MSLPVINENTFIDEVADLMGRENSRQLHKYLPHLNRAIAKSQSNQVFVRDIKRESICQRS